MLCALGINTKILEIKASEMYFHCPDCNSIDKVMIFKNKERINDQVVKFGEHIL